MKGMGLLASGGCSNSCVATTTDSEVEKKHILNDVEIDRLFSVRTAHYAPKEYIYNKGNHSDVVYIVRRGMVKLASHLSNGRVRIVRVHSTGAWLGLSGLVSQPYEHTAVAVNDVDIYRIPTSEVLRLKKIQPHLYCQLIEYLFECLRDADLWIAEFSTGTIRARVARLVNFLSRIENQSPTSEVRLLTCEDMAEILGVTPESVSRVLADFKRTKVLSPCSTARSKSHDCYNRDEFALNSIAQY